MHHTDWEWHASNMCHIYSGAYLIIGLTSSLGSKTSILGQRWVNTSNKTPLKTFETTLQYKHKLRNVYGRNILDESHLNFENRGMGASFNDANLQETVPMLTRGWVFQERVLARRAVHFHSSEMIW
jgi:hypothetical protein